MVLFPLHTARFQTRFLEPFFSPALEVLLNFSSGHDTAVLLLLFGRAEITTQRRPSMFLLKADNKEFTHFKTKSLYYGLLSFFFVHRVISYVFVSLLLFLVLPSWVWLYGNISRTWSLVLECSWLWKVLVLVRPRGCSHHINIPRDLNFWRVKKSESHFLH